MLSFLPPRLLRCLACHLTPGRQALGITNTRDVAYEGWSAGAAFGTHWLATTAHNVVGTALTGWCVKGCYGGDDPLPGDPPGAQAQRARMITHDIRRITWPVLYFMQMNDATHPTMSQLDYFLTLGNASGSAYVSKRMLGNPGGHCQIPEEGQEYWFAFMACVVLGRLHGFGFDRCPSSILTNQTGAVRIADGAPHIGEFGISGPGTNRLGTAAAIVAMVVAIVLGFFGCRKHGRKWRAARKWGGLVTPPATNQEAAVAATPAGGLQLASAGGGRPAEYMASETL